MASSAESKYVWSDEDTEMVKQFFAHLDDDGNGYISKEEALKLPGMDAFFKDCDSDKDDNVTWEELCAYLKRRSLEEHPAIPVGVMFYLLTQLLRKAITVKQFQAEMKVAYKKYRAQAKARLAKTKKSSSEADSKIAETKFSSSVADTI